MVEMVISVALLGVLMGGMVIMVAPILRSYSEEKQMLTATNVSNCVQEYITRSLRNASQICIVSNASYTDNGNAAVTGIVSSMKAYCDKKTTHTLNCISLRNINGQYYLCEEPITPASSGSYLQGNATPTASTKVFSDCLYNDLYMDFKFEPASVETTDPATGATTTTIAKDILATTVQTYTDATRKNMVFNGYGVTELRQIKVQLRAGAKEENYYLKFVDMGGTDDDHSDIYIYYVTRTLTGVS